MTFSFLRFLQMKEQYDLKVHETSLLQERLQQSTHHKQLEEIQALEASIGQISSYSSFYHMNISTNLLQIILPLLHYLQASIKNLFLWKDFFFLTKIQMLTHVFHVNLLLRVWSSHWKLFCHVVLSFVLNKDGLYHFEKLCYFYFIKWHCVNQTHCIGWEAKGMLSWWYLCVCLGNSLISTAPIGKFLLCFSKFTFKMTYK